MDEEFPTPSIPTERPTHSRLVVVEQIYFQSSNGMPVPNEVRFSRQLQTDEQPYIRRMKIGKEWQQLDTGWIEECGMLVIEHETPNWQVNPSKEERKEALERVVELATLSNDVPDGEHIIPDWIIPIGESIRGVPYHKIIYLRCDTETKIKITAYPK